MLKKISNTDKFILLFAIITAFLSWYLVFTKGYVLTYNDAASHLNIARRVIDNLTPGLAQIGTVWLPLPHILMLPLAMNDYLWHTGIAGSIVSIISYIISVVAAYKLIFLITKNKWGAILGALIMALNPNFLYLQTTAMTEPLLIATVMLSVFFMTKYLKSNTIKDLVLTGLFVSLSTLTRYEGWFIFMCLMILLPVWIYRLYGRKKAESSLILFLFSGGFGIFLWLLWNLAIFGDALYFITGPYSAYAQQSVLKRVGQLPTEGHLYTSILYYFWSMVDNNGLIILIGALIGVFIIPFIIKQKRLIIVPLVILLPVIFNIIALYFGQSAMNVPQATHNPGLFNIRYGIMALPAIALILGIIASNKYLRIVIILVLFAQSILFVKQGIPVSLADGINGLNNTYYTVEASKWLAQNYKGGLILTSLASHDAFVARAGLPMRLYVHEGTRNYWQSALQTPSKSVDYVAILSFPPDSVYKKLYKNPDFLKNFVLVHNYQKFEIYKKR